MTKFVVTDPDSGETVGPFETEEAAKTYFIDLANAEGWADVLELIEKTGRPFVRDGDEFVFTSGRSEQLRLVELSEPQ